jgi:hypothetical protein
MPGKRHTRSLRRTLPQRARPLAGKPREARPISRSQIRALEIELRPYEPLRVIAELSEPAVAVEAQDTTNATTDVVVVDMFWTRLVANRAHAVLLTDQLVELGCTDAVPPFQVMVAAAAVQPLLRLLPARVVARLAVGVSSTACAAVSRKLRKRLVLSAIRTPLHAEIVRLGYDSEATPTSVKRVSLAPFLHVRLYEVLGVFFQD